MREPIRRLSKSQYLRGLQCAKSLWLHRHRPELKPPISPQQQGLFDSGHAVGLLAQACFDDGHMIDVPYFAVEQAVAATRRAMEAGRGAIFEATACSPDGAFSRIDILNRRPAENGWDLIEVKQSTAVKDYHLDDIALQRYAFTGAGHDVGRSILMHLNRDYVRRGDLDVHRLFHMEDCTAPAALAMAAVPGRLADLLRAVNRPDEPAVPIGRHCRAPFQCDYVDYCWRHVPAYSVVNAFGGEKLDRLLAMNILDVRDLPATLPLTDRQRIDIRAWESGTVHVDRDALRDFLDRLVYPLYYLDYETVFPAVPLFDHSSPYQQIPFQFSLHIQAAPGGETDHVAFLHTDGSDPRPAFVQVLVENCGADGSVIVYNMPFESRINRELAARFPRHAAALEAVNARMVDLLVPFRSRHLYHPAMGGSASIKKVLPAFVPDLTYDALAIRDGDAAARSYMQCLTDMVDARAKQAIYDDLRRYCALDTWAEVRLVDVLHRFAV